MARRPARRLGSLGLAAPRASPLRSPWRRGTGDELQERRAARDLRVRLVGALRELAGFAVGFEGDAARDAGREVADEAMTCGAFEDDHRRVPEERGESTELPRLGEARLPRDRYALQLERIVALILNAARDAEHKPMNHPQLLALTIGRVSGTTIRLEDPSVSGSHAMISVHDGRVFLADVGSTNGTFVNGERVTSAFVTPHDRVLIGAVPFPWHHPNVAPLLAAVGTGSAASTAGTERRLVTSSALCVVS